MEFEKYFYTNKFRMLLHFLSLMIVIVIFISPATIFAIEMAENIFIISVLSFVDRKTTILFIFYF